MLMQVEERQLIRQQEILKALGFYDGAIDGIWGPKSIDAKKRMEASKFSPGIPNQGLPFQVKGPYPAGISLGQDGLLNHPILLEIKAKETEKLVSAKKIKEEQTTGPDIKN